MSNARKKQFTFFQSVTSFCYILRLVSRVYIRSPKFPRHLRCQPRHDRLDPLQICTEILFCAELVGIHNLFGKNEKDGPFDRLGANCAIQQKRGGRAALAGKKGRGELSPQ